MCRDKMSVDAAQPTPTPKARSSSRTSSKGKPSPTTTPSTTSTTATKSRPSNRSQSPRVPDPSSSNATSSVNYTSGSSYILDSTATTSVSSRTSLTSFRGSLPENPHIYDFTEIRSATNNFLAKRYSSSSTPCWRCTLRGKNVIVFQRKFRRSIETSGLRDKLSVVCRSHHMSIIKLLGASISGDHIYLVYEFIQGANLSDCLRNPRNPDFTILSTWMSRIQIATDLAHGLDYIHNNTGLNIDLVHKHVKSSSVIVTEPSFNAKLCHFGTAELCSETSGERKEGKVLKSDGSGEITEEAPESPPELRRSDSREMQFEGVSGYMSPEFQKTGIATQKSDVYAFGVVILELLSGKEPVKYKFDRASREYRKISIIDSASNVIGGGGGGGEREGVEVRLRRWMDRKLNDSFPVDVAEKVTRVALDCVHVDPDKRPSMRSVAGKISKRYLESMKWSETVRVPMDISVSLAPR